MAQVPERGRGCELSSRPQRLARPAQGADPRARSADHRSASSSVGSRGLALSARRPARRHQQRPQHPRHRVRAGARDAARRRAGGDEAGRRGRVRQRRRRDDGERHLRQDPRLRRHRRPCGPDARQPGRAGARGAWCAPAAGATAASATSPRGTPIRRCAIRAIRRCPACSATRNSARASAVLARHGLTRSTRGSIIRRSTS